jgi:hypothetical protein
MNSLRDLGYIADPISNLVRLRAWHENQYHVQVLASEIQAAGQFYEHLTPEIDQNRRYD